MFTDHAALVFLHTQQKLNAMMTTWYETLFAYDFKVYHKPGVRNILPDHLSRFFADKQATDLGGMMCHLRHSAQQHKANQSCT